MTSDYEAAHEGAALIRRLSRRFLSVTGKAPGQMLMGILTNRIPGELEVEGGGLYSGRVYYSAILTAKGRMITDLRVFRGREESYLLDLPWAGAREARSHLGKFLPPRLATVADVTSGWSFLTLVGPQASDLLSAILAEDGSGIIPASKLRQRMDALKEGEELVLSRSPFGFLRITANDDVAPPAWDLLLPRVDGEALQARLAGVGARLLVADTLNVLRVERGRPAFGRDMDSDTLPGEAGIEARAIDHQKGCYTGQEVVVRIRDRGQVNKHLRGLLLGDLSVPSPGEELFSYRVGRAVGRITSACFSPAFRATIALGYVSRRVHPGNEVRVGGEEGPPGKVVALTDSGWELSS